MPLNAKTGIWIAVTLAVIVAGGAAGWAVRRARKPDRPPIGGVQPDHLDALRAAREPLGGSVRAAIASLREGDAAAAGAALAEVEAQDPGNGYVAYLRMAVALKTPDYAAASRRLAAAASAERWDLYTDAAGLPNRTELSWEANVLQDAESGMREAVLSGQAADGTEGLARLRQAALGLCGAIPRDMLHLRIGAEFRRSASEAIRDLAVTRGTTEQARAFTAMAESDKAWQARVAKETDAYIEARPGLDAELTESVWLERVGGEEELVARLLADAPE